MINPVSSESAFAALFLLLSQTLVNGKPFVTTSRRMPQVSSVPSGAQPALFLLEAEEDVRENDLGLPVEELRAGVVVFFQVPKDPNAVPATVLNAYRDALVNQLRQFTLSPGGALPVRPMMPGTRQSLGGLVYHCRIQGKVLKNEGLQNGQGALVFPVSILTGM